VKKKKWKSKETNYPEIKIKMKDKSRRWRIYETIWEICSKQRKMRNGIVKMKDQWTNLKWRTKTESQNRETERRWRRVLKFEFDIRLFLGENVKIIRRFCYLFMDRVDLRIRFMFHGSSSIPLKKCFRKVYLRKYE
jgi:hypothetical protein